MEECWQIKLYGANDDGINSLIKKYNMTEKSIQDGIDIITDWYNKQPHLPSNVFDTQTFLRYYATCKFSIEIAKQKIDNNLTAKTVIKEFFKNRDPCDPALLKALKTMNYTIMPKIMPDHHRVCYFGFTDADIDFFDPHICMKYVFMESDLRTRYEYCYGDHYVWDLQHFKLAHALKITHLLRKILYIAQDCYGSRISSINFVNFKPYAQNILNVTKSLLKKKLADRIFVHESLEDLHKFIPKECLPEEVGGTCGSAKELNATFLEFMQTEKWRKWFIECESKIVDENKRPNTSCNNKGNVLEIVGSFRKLDVD